MPPWVWPSRIIGFHCSAVFVDRGVVVDSLYLPCSGIHLDLAEMPAVGIGADTGVDVTRTGCSAHAFAAKRRLVPFTVKRPSAASAGLELLGGELRALGDDALRRLVDGRPTIPLKATR